MRWLAEVRLEKIPTTSVRRRISRLSRATPPYRRHGAKNLGPLERAGEVPISTSAARTSHSSSLNLGEFYGAHDPASRCEEAGRQERQ